MLIDDIHELELGAQLSVENVRQWRQLAEANFAENAASLTAMVHQLEEQLWSLENGHRFSPSIEEIMRADAMPSPGAATLAAMSRRTQQSTLPAPGPIAASLTLAPGAGS